MKRLKVIFGMLLMMGYASAVDLSGTVHFETDYIQNNWAHPIFAENITCHLSLNYFLYNKNTTCSGTIKSLYQLNMSGQTICCNGNNEMMAVNGTGFGGDQGQITFDVFMQNPNEILSSNYIFDSQRLGSYAAPWQIHVNCTDNQTCNFFTDTIHSGFTACFNQSMYLNTTISNRRWQGGFSYDNLVVNENKSAFLNGHLSSPYMTGIYQDYPYSPRIVQPPRLYADTSSNLGCTTSTTTTTTTSTTVTTLPGNVTFGMCFMVGEEIGPQEYANVSNAMVEITWEDDGVIASKLLITDGYGRVNYTLDSDKDYTIGGYKDPQYPKIITYPGISGYILAQETECIPIVLVKSGNLSTHFFDFNLYTSYGTLPLTNAGNVFEAWECENRDDYSTLDRIKNNCERKFLIDGQFNYTVDNLYLPSDTLYVEDRYLSFFNGDYQEYKEGFLFESLSSTNSHAFIYGSGVTTDSVCFNFISRDSGSPVTVNYVITEASTATMSGSGASKCFDTNDLTKIYQVTTSGNANYNDYTGSSGFSQALRTADIRLTLKNVSAGSTYNITGLVIDVNDNPLSGITVGLYNCPNSVTFRSCTRITSTISTGSGYYFYGVGALQNYMVKTETNGQYIDNSMSFTLNGNMNLTLTVNPIPVNTNSLMLSVYTTNAYGNREPLDDAKVSVSCSGYNTKIAYTLSGSAIIWGIPSGADCTYSVEHDRYAPKRGISVNEGDYSNGVELEMFLEETIACSMHAEVILVNGTSNIGLNNLLVKILTGNGAEWDSVYTGDNGKLDAPVNCGETYTVTASYNGVEKSVTVQVQGTEGSTGTAILTFTSATISHQATASSFIDKLWGLVWVVFLIIFLFVLFVLLSLVDRIVKIGGR